MKKKYIIIIVLIALVLLMVFKLSSNKQIINKKNKPITDQNVVIPVKVTAAAMQVLERTITKTGTLSPFKETKAIAGMGGLLNRVNFNLGDVVSEGQILAVMDTRDQQLELQKAQSAAAKIKSDLDTYKELLQGNAATQQQVNNLQQDYRNVINQVAQAKRSLTDATIKAPTSGTIAAKLTEQGVFVNAGTEIATIVNLSKVKVQVNLTETEAYQVVKGQHVKIKTDVYPNQIFEGVVSFISPQADQANNYLTEIHMDNQQKVILRSGTFVSVDFSKKNSTSALVIPREALVQSVKDAGVYVVENGVARFKKIQVGEDTGDLLTVLSGLNEGAQVVTSGQINLKEGSRVSASR